MSRLTIAGVTETSTLGAAEVPNPPRVFLESALQKLDEAGFGNQTFTTKRLLVEDARRATLSAKTYTLVNKLDPTHIPKLDEIIADIEWLADIAIAEASPYPENPASIENWFPRLERAKTRLKAEISKFFPTIAAPTTSSTKSPPPVFNFPTGSGGGSSSGGTSTGPVSAGDVVQRTKTEASKTGTNKVFDSPLANTATQTDPIIEKICSSLPAPVAQHYASLGIDCLGLSQKDLAGVSICADVGMAYDPNSTAPNHCFEIGKSGSSFDKDDASPPSETETEKKSSALPWIIAGLAAVGATVWYLNKKKG